MLFFGKRENAGLLEYGLFTKEIAGFMMGWRLSDAHRFHLLEALSRFVRCIRLSGIIN